MVDYLDIIMFPCIGGFLIAVASSLNLLLKGRVTGFSGIVYNLWARDDPNNLWRWSLVYGLVFSCCILRLTTREKFFESQTKFHELFSIACTLVSGFLVGLGTKIGNGCTSGHGVCGLPRFSKRSFVAVGSFLFSAIGISTLRYHVRFFDTQNYVENASVNMYESTDFMGLGWTGLMLGISTLAIAIYAFIYMRKDGVNHTYDASDLVVGGLVGIIFGFGLCISGMVRREKVINFLAISSQWDPSLLFVLGVSVMVNVVTFYLIKRNIEIPYFSASPITFRADTLDANVILGPFIFGLGWGLSGLCPGPLMVNFLFYLPNLIIFTVMLLLGQIAGKFYLKWYDSLNSK